MGPGASENILYLFSSNQRPGYEIDAVNSVCLPSQFIMHFRYDIKHIDDNLKDIIENKKSSLNGKRVLIIFVNASGKESQDKILKPEFFPLRTGTLVEIKREKEVANFINFYFELNDEFVDYSKNDKVKLHKLINELQYKPIEGKAPGQFLSGIFATLQPPLSEGIFSKDPAVRAKIIDELLSVCPNRLFYYFEIRERNIDKISLKPVKFMDTLFPMAGFELSEGKKYSLIFTYRFNPKNTTQLPNINISVNYPSKIITVDKNPIQLQNPYDTIEIELTPYASSINSVNPILNITAQSPDEKKMADFEIPVIVNQSVSKTSKNVFVLMPFDDQFKIMYYNVLKPLIESLGFSVSKADENLKTGAVIEQIWESIRKASLVVADVTGNNPNVFYELGYANGLGKKVLIITGNERDIPFDISHFRHFEYHYDPDFESRKNELRPIFKENLE